jgi:hypothetical protein
MRIYVDLIMLNVNGVSMFLASYYSGLGHFFRYRPLLPIGWGTVQIVRQKPEENDKIQRQPVLVQYKQPANPLNIKAQLYSTYD